MGGRTTNKPGWSTEELSDMLKVSQRQLRYWVQMGLVSASLSPPKGRGHRLRFDLRDYLVGLVVKELMDCGISVFKVRKSVERIKTLWGLNNPLAELRVGCAAHAIFFKTDGAYSDALTGQQIFEIVLEKVRAIPPKTNYLNSKKLVDVALQSLFGKLAQL